MAQDTVKVSSAQVREYVLKNGLKFTIKGKDGADDKVESYPAGEETVKLVLSKPLLINRAKEALLASLETREQRANRKDRESRLTHFLLIDENRSVAMYEKVPYDQRLERDATRETFNMMSEDFPGSRVIVLIEGPADPETGKKNVQFDLAPGEDIRTVVRALAATSEVSDSEDSEDSEASEASEVSIETEVSDSAA